MAACWTRISRSWICTNCRARPRSSAMRYNKLMLRALKVLKKKGKAAKKAEKRAAAAAADKDKMDIKAGEVPAPPVTTFTCVAPSECGILASEVRVERSRIHELMSTFRKKIILGKEFDNQDMNADDDATNEYDDEEDDYESNEDSQSIDEVTRN